MKIWSIIKKSQNIKNMIVGEQLIIACPKLTIKALENCYS